MSEMVSRAIDCCLRTMDLVISMSPNELPKNVASEVGSRLQKVVCLLHGFKKTASLKTRKGREAAQDIEEAAINLERALSNLEPGDPSPLMKSLSTLEQRVEVLQKAIERLKRMVT